MKPGDIGTWKPQPIRLMGVQGYIAIYRYTTIEVVDVSIYTYYVSLILNINRYVRWTQPQPKAPPTFDLTTFQIDC